MRHRLERYIAAIFDKNRNHGDEQEQQVAEKGDPEGDGEAMVRSDRNAHPGTGEAQNEGVQDDVAPRSVAPVVENQPSKTNGGEPRLEVASRCHVGKVRPRNEDTCISFVSQAGGTEPLPLFGLFIVADGMGGHNDGHRASKLVARTVAQHVLDKLYRSLLQEGHSAMQQPVQETMEQAVALANQALAGTNTGKEMGTTLTAAVILGSRLFLVHVGDSRAYLMHEGKLSLVTTDHTFVQAMQDAGQLTAEEAAKHPNRNLLYRALMGETLEEPVDVFTRALPKRGTLMLCSDGLWGSISEQTISSVLTQDVTLQDKAERLLEVALESGGLDNITVILAAFEV